MSALISKSTRIMHSKYRKNNSAFIRTYIDRNYVEGSILLLLIPSGHAQFGKYQNMTRNVIKISCTFL